MFVKKCQPLPAECIVRGYLSGSGWAEYKTTGAIAGLVLPPGLIESQKLPQPVFTPSTKAAQGLHDENISFTRMAEIISMDLAIRVRDISLALYERASAWAEPRGIIIADTKFEFGLDEDGELILIDEVLTPDSSRFWEAAVYSPGKSQVSFDKQPVRDYLDTLKPKWNKKPPPPPLPKEVVDLTTIRYREALRRLTGKTI